MGNKASALPSPSPLPPRDQEILPGLTEIESRVDSAKICADMSGEIINARYIINNPDLYNNKVILYVFDTSHNLIHGEIFKKEKINDSRFPATYGFANREKLIPFKYISACQISDEDLEVRPNTNTHHITLPTLGIISDPKPGPKWEDVLYNPKKYNGKVIIYGNDNWDRHLLFQRFSLTNLEGDFRYNFSDSSFILAHNDNIHFCYPSNNQVKLYIDAPISFIPGQRTGQCLFNSYETILFYADVIRHVVLDKLQTWLTYKELLALPTIPGEKETSLTQFVKTTYPEADASQLSFFEQIFFRYIYRQLLQYDISTLNIVAPNVTPKHRASLFGLDRRNSVVSTASIEKISTTSHDRIIAKTAANYDLYGTKAITLAVCKERYHGYRSFTMIEPLLVPHIVVFSGNSLNLFHFNKIKDAILAFHISIWPPAGFGHSIAIIKNKGDWYLCDGNIGIAKRIAQEKTDFMIKTFAVHYEDYPRFQMVVESEATMYQITVEGQAPTILYRHGAKVHSGGTRIFSTYEQESITIYADARTMGSGANLAAAEAAAVAKAKSDEAAATAAAKNSAISMVRGWMGSRIGGERRRQSKKSRKQRKQKRRSTRK